MVIAIIGAGIIGLATAYELTKNISEDIFLLEKEPYLCHHASGRNSGVIHSGIYYTPGSNKAKFSARGRDLLYEFCKTHNIIHKKIGKIIVASTEEEKQMLLTYLENAKKSSVDVDVLEKEEISALQPEISGFFALYLKDAGILDVASYEKTLEVIIKNSGVHIVTNARVTEIIPKKNSFVVKINHKGQLENFEVDFIFNCAGVYADEVARMINPDISEMIMPVRGEYYKFYKKKRKKINQTLIYPAPIIVNNRKYLGIHLTPTFNSRGEISDLLLVGPAPHPITDKEDYENNRLPASHFYEQVIKYLPSLKQDELKIDMCGILAKLKDKDDFVIMKDNIYQNCVHNIGIDSPGITSSLAIAEKNLELYLSSQ